MTKMFEIFIGSHDLHLVNIGEKVFQYTFLTMCCFEHRNFQHTSNFELNGKRESQSVHDLLWFNFNCMIDYLQLVSDRFLLLTYLH